MLLPYYHKNNIEAGCDEAGRGCLAGPVVAAAVILPKNYKNSLLNDSKQITEKTRDQLRLTIEKDAIDYAISFVPPSKIDEINILQASILGMHQALQELKKPFDFILVDGNRFKPYPLISHQCIVKGDEKYMSIAAASILAKTYRDEYMRKMDIQYPQYLWKKNMGYPTKAHRSAIEKFGVCELHRLTFKLLADAD